jgi:FAD/FMN-containing dehydrogenase
MKRRAFCATGLAALTAVSFPGRRLAAASAGGEIPAVGLDGRQLTLKSADIDDLRAVLRGELITAQQPGYDTARRLWNPAFDRHPALIVRCLGASDVKGAVSFAAAHGLLTAVHAGGHSFAGQSGCDGGLVIDVSPMRAVEVDPLKRQARVESGALLGYLDREAQAFGLATTAGVAADTGVAGLTLGGGMGRLGRRFGLACDNLTAVELVTADGRWVRASAEENPDLLWALKGGGGNFGVVTAFSFRLHELGPQVFGGTIRYPFADARQVLRSLADFVASAPDELYVDAAMFFSKKGERVLELDVCYSGPLKDAQQVVAPLRKLGKPFNDELAAALYVKLQGSADTPGVSDYGAYLKGGLVEGLTAALIDTAVGYIESTPSDSFYIAFQHAGGAISRVAPTDTAYWNRGANYSMGVIGFWKVPGDGAERNTEWVRGAWKQLEPLTHGRYVNITSDPNDSHAHTAAYGDNYPRLAALKKRYDPSNLFRLNANIKPAV